jgi:hypothetical protein
MVVIKSCLSGDKLWLVVVVVSGGCISDQIYVDGVVVEVLTCCGGGG